MGKMLKKSNNGGLSLNGQVQFQEQELKILVIGDVGTGKTSLVKRHVHQFFPENCRATIGIACDFKIINREKNNSIRLLFWDISGQKTYRSMARVFYKKAVGAFIVFDVTKPETFVTVVEWKRELDLYVQLSDGLPIPCVLLANKCDQTEETFFLQDPSEMDDYCKENGFLTWFETSAKENVNIDIAINKLVGEIFLRDVSINCEKGKDVTLTNVKIKKKRENCTCNFF